MKKIIGCLTVILSLTAGISGCGSKGGSSVETLTPDVNTATTAATTDTTGTTTGGLTVSLTKSGQGTSGAFMDINGDGLADQVVGAPYADSSRGVLIIYTGSSAGFSTTPVELKGEAVGDNFGYSFKSIGDVDGDGIKDFAVGAINAEGETLLSGAVYIYKGGKTPTLLIKLNGEGPGDKFGWSIASGDINGDGKTDIVVSAFSNSGAAFQGGAVYAYPGNGDGTFKAPVSIYDKGTNKGLGYSVTAGDINGDGIADIIAGESAAVFVWYGNSDLTTISFAAPNATIYGAPKGKTGGSGFGKAVAVIGDIDGDKFNDLAIGNPNRGTYDTYDNKGSVYVFKGGSYAAGTVLYEDGKDSSDNPGARIAKIIGENGQDRFGSFILPVGDAVGADTATPGGSPDFIVTAVWGGSKAEGKAYLFSGEHVVEHGTSSPDDMAAAHANTGYTGEATCSGFGTFCSITKEGPDGLLLIGIPLISEGTGSVKMLKLSDGTSVAGGATGGGTVSEGFACH